MTVSARSRNATAIGGVAVAMLLGVLFVVSARDDPAATAPPGEEISVTSDSVEFGDRLVGLIGNMARADGRTYVIAGHLQRKADLLFPPGKAVLAAFDDAGVERWRTELDGRPTDVVAFDGDLWVVRGDGVSRIDDSDGRILGHVTLEGKGDRALTGAFGSVWVTAAAPSGDAAGRLVRVDSDLSTTSIDLPRVDPEDGRVLAGPEAGAGAIWVPRLDQGVAAIDPDTNEVTVIPADDIGHEVLHVAVEGDVAYVASDHQVTSIVDGEVRATVAPGEIRYLGPIDGVFGVLDAAGQFHVLQSNDPMVVQRRQTSTEGGPTEIDGEAWMETGSNYDLRRVELLPVS